jgi:general secretion pathway protein D
VRFFVIGFSWKQKNNTIFFALTLMVMSFCGSVQAQVQEAGQSPSGEQTWTVNFNDSEIQEVIKFIAGATGKTIIIDPKVRGPIKVINTKPLNARELYELFLASLDVHGFTAVESGNIVRIVMNRDARNLPIPTENNVVNKDDLYITQVIPLKNTSAAKILAALRPLVPQYGHLTTYEPSNALIITDTRANVARMNELVVQLDRIGSTETEVIPLKYASATDVIAMITQLEKPDPNRGITTAPPVFVADKRINAIVISGDELSRKRIKYLIEDLDRPQTKNNNVRVVYLKYAKAADVQAVLSGMLQNMSATAQGGEGAPPSQQVPPSVQADEATNSVLISANVDTMGSIMSIIESLDIRRAQVLVEAIIVEVSGSNNKELGIEWMYRSDDYGVGGSVTKAGAGLAAGVINLESGPDDKNAALGTLATGLGAIPGQTFGVGRLTDKLDFVALLRMLQSNTSSNILSTPNLLTTDNTEASILVGEQVPFPTGSFSGGGGVDGGGGNNNGFSSPFNTINREDVGIKLQVTPHINDGDGLVLDIEQEISSVKGVDPTFGPTTSKREVKTQILAADGQTVVLGGLIQDNLLTSDTRVPVLGSIPILGHLFRSQTSQKSKTNLLIFIRPTIIRDDQVLTGATAEKYAVIRQQQVEFRRNKGLLPRNSEVPMLPEWEQKIEEYKQASERARQRQLDPNSSEPVSTEEPTSTEEQPEAAEE